jgi:hypothetical protein
MPDPTGKLTPEELKKAHDWLAKYSPGAETACPICRSTTWIIAEHLVQPVTLRAGLSIQLGGLSYPQVMVISNPCGYTMFLNAVLVGILVGTPPVSPPENQPPKG